MLYFSFSCILKCALATLIGPILCNLMDNSGSPGDIFAYSEGTKFELSKVCHHVVGGIQECRKSNTDLNCGRIPDVLLWDCFRVRVQSKEFRAIAQVRMTLP